MENTNFIAPILHKNSSDASDSYILSPPIIPALPTTLPLSSCESSPIQHLNTSDYIQVKPISKQCLHTELLLQTSEANETDLNLQDTLLPISNLELTPQIPKHLEICINIEQYCPPSPLEYKSFIVNNWPHINMNVNLNNCFNNIYSLVRASGLPNYLAAKQPLTSGLKINNWKLALLGYQDQQLLEFLEFGWPADYTASKLPKPTLSNHKELLDYSKFIIDYITEEIHHGALLGPFNIIPFVPWAQFSPIMTREKKQSIKRRIIVNLSYPKGNSVNSGIKKGFYQGKPLTFSLPTINNIINNLTKSQTEKFIWSIDLARAYRQLRTDPLSVPLFGITMKNKMFFDLALPFGCRTSAMACARTTSAVVHIIKKEGYHCLCYLDDFVGIETTKEKAIKAYKYALSTLNYLGLDISAHKCKPPCQLLTWIGYEIDTKNLIIKIPEDKLEEILVECKKWNINNMVTKKEVQKLAGKLNFISKCIKPTKCYMNRILTFLRNTPKIGKTQVNNELLYDISWFLEFASDFNGIILLTPVAKPNWYIECDACLEGGGGFSKEKYISEKLNGKLVSMNLPICELEAINLVTCLEMLKPPITANFNIVIFTDNKTAQSVFESGYGRNKTLTAAARFISKFQAIHSCSVTIRHKPGKELIVADALSRAFMNVTSHKISMEYILKMNLTRVTVNHYQIYCNIFNIPVCL